jgi:hypothetical protein
MAFPNDLNDVVVFKIHPAIGIARVSKNDDFFIFGTDPGTYKSNGLMKRQAVQFRIFAYGENNVGLGELTPAVMKQLYITPVWSAKVANRKIAFMERRPLSDTTHVISAEASSNDATGGLLVGSLPDFLEGGEIPLGQITPDGVFMPPKARVHRKRTGLPVPQYPDFTAEIADNSCDGTVSCALGAAGGALPVLPACIIVAPNDYSPDVNPEATPGDSLLERLHRDIQSAAGGASGTLHNQTARQLDEHALRPCTGDFAPGFEVSFGSRGEVPNIKALFYHSGSDPHTDPRDMRVHYAANPGEPGAVLGQLTSGLCSPWQTDFTACTGYWTENLPVQAFLDEGDQVGINIYRKKYADHSAFPDRFTAGDDYERHQDQIGIVRLKNARLIETERNPGDDITDVTS